MNRKIFFLSALFLSAIFLSLNFIYSPSSVYAFDTIPAESFPKSEEANIECPAACPCCDELMPDFADTALDFNDVLDDLKYGLDLPDEEFGFPNTRKLQEQRASAIPRTQSADQRTADQGWKDYNDAAKKLREMEKDMNKYHDLVNQDLDDMEQDAKDMIDAIDKFLACPCMQDIDDCCQLSGAPCSDYLKKLKAMLEDFLKNTLPELRTANSNARLAALAEILHHNQTSLDAFKRNMRKLQDMLKKIPPVEIPKIEMMEDCCKKGKEECAHDWLGVYLPVDWLIQSGVVSTSLTGFDRATGHIGDLTITNNTGEIVSYTIPRGSVLFPGSSDVQRIMTTSAIRGTLNPGESLTVAVNGVCLDSTLYPPPSGDPFGLNVGTSFDSFFDVFFEIPSLGDLFSSLFAGGPTAPSSFWEDDSWDDILDMFYGHGPSDHPADDINNFIDYLFGGSFSGDYFDEYILLPTLMDILDEMYENGEIDPTGLPPEMEYATLLQWLYWDIMDDFDEDDGRERIGQQVQESGGTQTPEQVNTLNSNIWGNIDTVKKKAKSSSSTGIKLLHNNREVVPVKTSSNNSFIDRIGGLFSFESLAFAEDSSSLQDAALGAANALKKSTFLLTALKHLTYDLEHLVQTAYSKQIADTSVKTAQPVRKGLDKMRTGIEKNKPKFTKNKKLTQKDYQKIREINAKLAKKGGELNGLWNAIQKELRSVYPKWDEAYQALLEKSEQSKKDGKEYSADFSKEEREFFKIFSRVKLYYVLLQRLYS